MATTRVGSRLFALAALLLTFAALLPVTSAVAVSAETAGETIVVTGFGRTEALAAGADVQVVLSPMASAGSPTSVRICSTPPCVNGSDGSIEPALDSPFATVEVDASPGAATGATPASPEAGSGVTLEISDVGGLDWSVPNGPGPRPELTAEVLAPLLDVVVAVGGVPRDQIRIATPAFSSSYTGVGTVGGAQLRFRVASPTSESMGALIDTVRTVAASLGITLDHVGARYLAADCAALRQAAREAAVADARARAEQLAGVLDVHLDTLWQVAESLPFDPSQTECGETTAGLDPSGMGLLPAFDPTGAATAVAVAAVTLTYAVSTAPGTSEAATPELIAATPTAPDAGTLPREVMVGGEYFLQDRVPRTTPAGLSAVGAVDGRTIYARTSEPPFDALFVPVSDRPADGALRYLSEQTTRPDVPCPAEANPIPLTLADGSVYVFAGIEPDVDAASLAPLSGDYFYEPESPRPLPEILRAVDGAFERYILTGSTEDAPVPQIASGPRFGGQTWAYRETIPNDAAAQALAPVRVGCAGPFKVSTEEGQDTLGALTKIYIQVGDRVLVYNVASESACAPLDATWDPVLAWLPDIQNAQRRVQEELGVLVPTDVILAEIMIETQGIMPDEPSMSGAVGLFQITPMTLGAQRYDFARAEHDAAYSIEIGVTELALRYEDSRTYNTEQPGQPLPWENIIVGFFSGHYFPNGAASAFNTDFEYQQLFIQYRDELNRGCMGSEVMPSGLCTDPPCAVASPPAAICAAPPCPAGDWLAAVGQPPAGLAYLWGGDTDAPIVQEFGPTDFSVNVHPDWYAYSLDYGFSQPGHTGIDIGMPVGTPLYAPVDAVVVCAGTLNPGFPEEEACASFTDVTNAPTSGRLQLRLPNGDMLIYGQVRDVIVEPGSHVQTGQLIGHTGSMNGDHLHLEYRTPDPSTPSGWRILDPRLTPLNGLERE